MSSSLPRKARANRAATLSAKLLPCPECGTDSLGKVQGDCTLLDGTVIHDLSRYHCSHCGTDLFDRSAMREIRRQRIEKKRTKEE